jgi:RecA-family ATPase
MSPRDANDIARELGADGLREMLDEAVAAGPEPEAKSHVNGSGTQATEPITPFETFDAGNWEAIEITLRRWTILNRIPAGEPGIISGDGGTGKTLLMLQACVAIAAGRPDWMNGIVDTEGPVIVFSAEEKLAEMHRRVGRILAHLGLSFRDLAGRLHFVCDPDDVTMATVDRNGIVAPSRSLLRLEKSVELIRPAFVLIENAAEVYPANEIARSPVSRFVRKYLGGLAGPNDAAVGLIQHPSVSGLKDGTGRSGSTGWNNAGRWRMNFTYADADDDGGSSTRIRKLEIVKNNYGPAGETVEVRWHQEHGVFVPVSGGSALDRAAAEAPIDEAFLHCLEATAERGETVGTNSKGNWAPRVFEGMPEANGYRQRTLLRAMNRLLTEKRVKIVKAATARARPRSWLERA